MNRNKKDKMIIDTMETRNLCDTVLQESQTYTFYYTEEVKGFMKLDKFRANFINILTNGHGSTLRVDNYIDEHGACSNTECVYSMPTHFIGRVESCDDNPLSLEEIKLR